MPSASGKSEKRLAVAILLTAVVPLLAALFLFGATLNRATVIGTSPDIAPALERNVELYKDYVRILKNDMRHQAEAMAFDPALHEALQSKKPAALQHALDDLLSRYPDMLSVAVEDDSSAFLAERSRHPAGGAAERGKDFRVPLRDAPSGTVLVARFAVDGRYQTELEQVGALRDRYQALEKNLHNDYVAYFQSFAVLLISTVVVTVVIGFLLARGVTRRINRLADAIGQVAQGSFEVRVPVTGSDELTELARVFNRMLEEMQQSRARIEYLQRVGAWQEMARRLAHEIKNPLTPIQLAVQQCHRKYTGDDRSYRKLLDTTAEIVEEEVGTLRRLVTNFSNFARLPHPELVLSDLGDFLKECREQAQKLGEMSGDGDEGVTLGMHDVVIQWVIPDERLPSAFDRQLLRRVLINLVRNAMQATQGGHHEDGGNGRVRVSAKLSSGGTVLTIEDDGPGVPPELRDRIFDPYVTTKADGTGLGLAIVKKVIVEHGGTIDVGESQDLGGALFAIRLPLPESLTVEVARARLGEAAELEV